MGGERFETVQPEMYLFGENQDLNFLGSRPVPVCVFYYDTVYYFFGITVDLCAQSAMNRSIQEILFCIDY